MYISLQLVSNPSRGWAGGWVGGLKGGVKTIPNICWHRTYTVAYRLVLKLQKVSPNWVVMGQGDCLSNLPCEFHTDITQSTDGITGSPAIPQNRTLCSSKCCIYTSIHIKKHSAILGKFELGAQAYGKTFHKRWGRGERKVFALKITWTRGRNSYTFGGVRPPSPPASRFPKERILNQIL